LQGSQKLRGRNSQNVSSTFTCYSDRCQGAVNIRPDASGISKIIEGIKAKHVKFASETAKFAKCFCALSFGCKKTKNYQKKTKSTIEVFGFSLELSIKIRECAEICCGGGGFS